MVAEPWKKQNSVLVRCSLAKISMVAEHIHASVKPSKSCSLAKISMVAEPGSHWFDRAMSCSLAKISMVAEQKHRQPN